jgi:ketosteroid isomerase-like protein
VIRFVDKDKKLPKQTAAASENAPASHIDDFFRTLKPEMGRPQQAPDPIASAMETVQRLAAETDAEQAAEAAQEMTSDFNAEVCRNCGHRNRFGNQFCGMCGGPLGAATGARAGSGAEEERLPQWTAGSSRPAIETHHYHHHYHHHYLPGGYDGAAPRAADSAREDKLKPNAALRGDMSRAEAAVRRITHEWVLACNTKHLDDLMDLYVADPLVLRSNYPPVRGAAAVREFFFGALDSGLGEVEVEPLRVDVAGELAYEAGRCKALVPSATGKRREERGKYLWVFARQSNGEWRLAADCWSSDLTLTVMESDIPTGAGVKTREPRKS